MSYELPPEGTVVIGTVKTMRGLYGVALSHKGLGRLTFPSEPLELCVKWATRWYPNARILHQRKYLTAVKEELNDYFKRKRKAFNLPLDLCGTPFQVSVWRELLQVSYGEVQTYKRIALNLKLPRSMRAVGRANGANPVPIIVPCHRIIGTNGKLVGYGGGLDLKHQLLQLEGVMM